MFGEDLTQKFFHRTDRQTDRPTDKTTYRSSQPELKKAKQMELFKNPGSDDIVRREKPEPGFLNNFICYAFFLILAYLL